MPSLPPPSYTVQDSSTGNASATVMPRDVSLIILNTMKRTIKMIFPLFVYMVYYMYQFTYVELSFLSLG